jgi:hypothetical protein
MPNISEKFKLLKYNFGKPRRNVKFYDKKLGLIAEADIVMADDGGNYVKPKLNRIGLRLIKKMNMLLLLFNIIFISFAFLC